MNNKAFITACTILTTLSLLVGCSTKNLSTNLDRDNFHDYFSPAKVTIYQQEKDITTRHKYIGVVEGQDCQIKPHHAEPDEINARTQARRQAFEQHANGVIFTGCALLSPQQLATLNNSNDAQQCHAIVICYARAFAIEPATEK